MTEVEKMSNELPRDAYTEFMYDELYDGAPVSPDNAEEIIAGIERTLALEERPIFLEGLSARLTQLGIPCRPDDTEIMLAEIKRRYHDLLGKPCPRTVQNWIRGTVPGVTNRQNHYDLCFALEMDEQQTGLFFQKHYLTLPFYVKNKADAVFLYCLHHHKPYQTAVKLLEESRDFVDQENAHTATSQIKSVILQTENEEAFSRYLSAHCYGNEQQFQLARQKIKLEIERIKDHITKYDTESQLTPDRLNSATIFELLGYRYQSRDKSVGAKLPKRFTESLPNDVTLGKIINDEEASYELLRKTMMLLRFYNFYSETENTDHQTANENLMDFHAELDEMLYSCGFAQTYLRHPFDCLLLYCANSFDPVTMLHTVIEYGRN